MRPFTADHWKMYYWLHCIVLWVLPLFWTADVITALCPNVINIILAQWNRVELVTVEVQKNKVAQGAGNLCCFSFRLKTTTV